jgi:uncharacterized surface protein with fasciclin (FAS1) repeats
VPYGDIGYGRNIATWLRVAPILNLTGFVFDAGACPQMDIAARLRLADQCAISILQLAAGLTPKTLDNELVATLFVPSDAAWEAFLKAADLTPAELLANKPLATKLARNHVVPGVALRLLDLDNGDKLATMGQSVLTVRPVRDASQWWVVAGRATAMISVPDLIANKAIIHVIDAVLTPDSVRVEQP